MNIGLGIGIPFSRSILYRALNTSLYLDFVSNETLDSRVTFTRASSATRINSSGLIETVASNAPRFDYDPVTLQPKGLLIEEQRTNLLTYSEQFDNAGWTLNNATVTANAASSPAGSMTGDALVENTTASVQHRIQSAAIPVVSGQPYTFSFYVKAAGRAFVHARIITTSTNAQAAFDLTARSFLVSAGTTATITSIGSGWSRCTLTGTTDGTSAVCYVNLAQSLSLTVPSYTGDGTSGIYIWGAQLEAGSFPTSYIPTTSAAATRAADVAVMTGANFSSWYRQDEGALFAEGDSSGGTTPCFVSVDDATTANRIQLRRGSLTNTTASFRMVSSGGSIDVTLVSSPASIFKQAAAVKASDQMSAANGSLFTLTPVPTMPVVTQATIGNGIGSTYLNGHIRRIAYFPRRLSNAELQGITA